MDNRGLATPEARNELGRLIAGGLGQPTADIGRTLSNDQLCFARDQGLLPILAHIQHQSRQALAPPGREAVLRSAYRLAVSTELARRHCLNRLLSKLHGDGIDNVLMKGEVLAHTLYPAPWLRTRADSDLLVRAADVGRTERILAELGYRQALGLPGGHTQRQHTWSLTCGGVGLQIDLHWRVTNSAIVDHALEPESLLSASRPLDGFGSYARRPDDAHMLLHACIHRVAHHDNSDRWLWLLDIHLLVNAADSITRRLTVDLARMSRTRDIVADGITRTARVFGTQGAQAWLSALQAVAPPAPETSARLLIPGSRLRRFGLELAAARWPVKFALLCESALPPATYLRSRFPQYRHHPTWRLHAKRWHDGWHKYLR